MLCFNYRVAKLKPQFISQGDSRFCYTLIKLLQNWKNKTNPQKTKREESHIRGVIFWHWSHLNNNQPIPTFSPQGEFLCSSFSCTIEPLCYYTVDIKEWFIMPSCITREQATILHWDVSVKIEQKPKQFQHSILISKTYMKTSEMNNCKYLIFPKRF